MPIFEDRYHPFSYILNASLLRRLFAGEFQFPIFWNGVNNNGEAYRTIITKDYLFAIALRLDPNVAEQMVMRSVVDTTINILLLSLEISNCLHVPSIVRIIEYVSSRRSLTRSFSGVTVYGCIDIYDDAVVRCDRNDDLTREIRRNLVDLADRMSSRRSG